MEATLVGILIVLVGIMIVLGIIALVITSAIDILKDIKGSFR